MLKNKVTGRKGVRSVITLRHNERDGVSNDQPRHCLLNRLFRCRSKEISKLHTTGLCAGNSAVTGEFTAQRASNEEDVFTWWRHYDSMEIKQNDSSYFLRKKIIWKTPLHFYSDESQTMQMLHFGWKNAKLPFIFRLKMVFHNPNNAQATTILLRRAIPYDRKIFSCTYMLVNP